MSFPKTGFDCLAFPPILIRNCFWHEGQTKTKTLSGGYAFSSKVRYLPHLGHVILFILAIKIKCMVYYIVRKPDKTSDDRIRAEKRYLLITQAEENVSSVLRNLLRASHASFLDVYEERITRFIFPSRTNCASLNLFFLSFSTKFSPPV